MKLRFCREKNPKAVLLLTTVLLLLTIIPLYHYPQKFPRIRPSSFTSPPPSSPCPPVESIRVLPEDCDLFKGDWVPDPKAPYYSNDTCLTIHERQNCIKYGRPDTEFMKWRWKPQGCELPLFDPALFLHLVKGKSMAFVGDSVARNQMQSMMCLLSKEAHPVEVNESRFSYAEYNFTVAHFWSTFLVKADSTGPDENLDGAFHLHVDKPDAKWTAGIEPFDFVIFSAGQWFFRPSFFYEENKLVGCYRCHNSSVNETIHSYGYRRAFRSAFAYLNSMPNYNGMTFLRTYSPSHFENGQWNKGGDCVRTSPLRSNETEPQWFDMQMHLAQVEEYRVAEKAAAKRGLKYHLLDITGAMLLRPDGHPSRYGHPKEANVTIRDCVHWCLPGPMDSWSGFLLEILRRDRLKEIVASRWYEKKVKC